MVATPALFDTNILIDFLSGVDKARAVLEGHPDRAISIVTWMEVMAGTAADEEREARALLLGFRVFPVTQEVAEEAYVLRRDRRIKLPDAIIQATARLDGRTLFTRNTRDFTEGQAGIEIPYRL